MRKIPLTLVLLTITNNAIANSLEFEGEIIHSEVTEKLFDCGSYQVRLETDKFPFKYERNIPEKFRLNGFMGSPAIVRKEAYLLPKSTLIPRPDQLKKMKAQLVQGRTYLPTAVACKDDTFIVSYWSGGNCAQCEVFVQFSAKDGVPSNPQKVNYGRVKAFK